MEIELSVDASRLHAALAKAPSVINRELRVELKKQMQLVQKIARRRHRFRRKTGSLQRSILQEVKKLTGQVYLEEGIASYGYSVHQGHHQGKGKGGWAPDQFVFSAFRSRINSITDGMNKAMETAIRKAGLK